MKKTAKIFFSSVLALSFALTTNFSPINGQDVSAAGINDLRLKEYPYSLSDHLNFLKRAFQSIERYPESPLWKKAPENLLLVFLWNKENFHDDSLVPFAEKWQALASKQDKGRYSEQARLAVVFASLIRQDYPQAQKELTRKAFSPENDFLVEVANLLISSGESANPIIKSHRGLTLSYRLKVTAIGDARKLVKKYPDSALANYLLASVLAENKGKDEDTNLSEEEKKKKEDNNNELLALLDRSLSLDPFNLLYQLRRTELVYDKNPADAEIIFAEITAKSLNNSYVSEKIANFFTSIQFFDKSIEYLKFAIENDPQRKNLYKKMHSLYGFAYPENLLELRGLYERAISENPFEQDFYYLLASVYQESQDLEKVEDVFRLAVKNNPGNPELQLFLADTLAERQKFDDAINAYLEAIKLNEKNPDPYLKLISLYWEKDNSEKVLELARQMLKSTSSASIAYLWLGTAYLKQNKPDLAVENILQAVKSNNRDPIAYNSLGIAYRAWDKNEEAIISFRKALLLNPNYLDSRINLGDTYLKMKDYRQAEEIYTKAVENSPYDPSLYFALGNLFTETEDFAKAEENYQKAILLKIDFMDARNNLGNSYIKRKDYNRAMDQFNQILRLDPGYATAYYNIACIYSLENNPDSSLEFLTKALNIDPALREIAKNDTDFTNVRENERFQALLRDK